MKTGKLILSGLCILVLSAASLAAESFLNEEFTSFGIKSIGIYSEGYEDKRVEDFEKEYLRAYSNQYVNTFRYTLCSFEGVTPKLMTPGYPVSGSKATTETDRLIGEELSAYLQKLDWKTSVINSFSGGSLTDLLSEAKADGLDAVMVVRYFPIKYFIPFSGYSSIQGYSTITTSARVGKLMNGLGLLPAAELYDTETGLRLWYSAFYTGHMDGDDGIPFQTTVDNAGAYFIEGDSPEAKAVETMVELTLDTGKFPKATAANRNEAAVAAEVSGSKHMFWTDYPEYDFYGTLLGFGYNLSYISDFEVYYSDPKLPYDSEPIPAGSVKNMLMHTVTFPMFTFATRNISFDPGSFIGLLQPKSTTLRYDKQVDDDDNPNTPDVTQAITDEATIWGINVGFDAALKYYLRFTDDFSAFVGGRAYLEMWLVNVSSQYEASLANVVGCITELDPFVFNASVIAGLRFDSSAPIELFAMYTPIGPGGSAMISAGLNWHGINYEWIAPHAKSVEPMMHW